jgi:hypothetical protein
MKTFVSRSLVCLGSATCVFALSTFSSSAVPLVPGSSVAPVFEAEPVGGVQLNQVVANYAGLDIQGTVTSTVISGDTSNPFGGLTFTYEIVANISSIEGVNRFTVGNFAPYLTDVSYNNVAVPGVIPNTVDRSGTGNTVGFNWVELNVINGGQSSALLVVQTDSQVWAPTIASVIDASAETVPSLAPVAVPEPTAMALVGLGAGALLALRRRKS